MSDFSQFQQLCFPFFSVFCATWRVKMLFFPCKKKTWIFQLCNRMLQSCCKRSELYNKKKRKSGKKRMKLTEVVANIVLNRWFFCAFNFLHANCCLPNYGVNDDDTPYTSVTRCKRKIEKHICMYLVCRKWCKRQNTVDSIFVVYVYAFTLMVIRSCLVLAINYPRFVSTDWIVCMYA